MNRGRVSPWGIAAFLVVLVACGGGGDAETPIPTVASVRISSEGLPVFYPGSTHVFTATVSAGEDRSVTWSTTIGTIDARTGAFTAPDSPGQGRVTATSVADPARQGSLDINVVARPTPQFIGGLWKGTLTNYVVPNEVWSDVSVIALDSGELRVAVGVDATPNNQFQHHGSLSITNGHAVGELASVSNEVVLRLDGNALTGASFTGGYTVKNTGNGGAFNWRYQQPLSSDKSLAGISGTWQSPPTGGGNDAPYILSIDRHGYLSGGGGFSETWRDSRFSGAVQVADAGRGLYRITLRHTTWNPRTEQDRTVTYEGLMALREVNGGRALLLMTSSPESGIFARNFLFSRSLPAVSVMEGVWTGTHVRTPGGTSSPLKVLLAPDGMLRALTDEGDVVAGVLSLETKALAGNMSFELPSSGGVSTYVVSNGTLSGEVDEAGAPASLTATYEAGSQGGTLTATADAKTRRPADLSKLAGTWSSQRMSRSGGSCTFTLNAQGGLSGQFNGWALSGSVSVISPATNLYAVSVRVENGAQVTSRGLLTLDDTDGGAENLLHLITGTGQSAVSGRFIRQ